MVSVNALGLEENALRKKKNRELSVCSGTTTPKMLHFGKCKEKEWSWICNTAYRIRANASFVCCLQDREDELRAMAIQMRRREREKRHKEMEDSDSDSRSPRSPSKSPPRRYRRRR